MSRFPRRLARFAGFVASLAVLAIIGLLLGVAFAPAQVITPLAYRLTDHLTTAAASSEEGSSGIILRNLTIAPAWRTTLERDKSRFFNLGIDHAELEIEGTTVAIEASEVSFTFSQLLGGELAAVRLGRLTIVAGETHETQTASGTAQSTANQLLTLSNQLLALPVKQITLAEGHIALPANLVTTGSGILELRGELLIDSASKASLAVDASLQQPLTAGRQIHAEARIADNAVSTRLEIEPTLLAALLPIELQNSLREYGVTLEFRRSPMLTLQLTLRNESTGLEALDFSASPFWSKMTLTQFPGASLVLNSDGLSVTCRTLQRCQGDVDLQLRAQPVATETLTLGEVTLRESSLELPLTFESWGSEVDLTSQGAQLTIPSWEYGVSRGALTGTIPKLTAHLGPASALKASVQSQSLQISHAGVSLLTPALSITIDANASEASAVAEFSLGSTTVGGAAIVHSIERSTGSIDLRIEPPVFETAALSSLIDYSAVGLPPFDLIAGSASLRADVSWSKQPNNSWAVGGPVIAKLHDLSGYSGESLFVSANTELFAELTPDLALRNFHPAQLRIASIDSGFVFENASLAYEFVIGPSEPQTALPYRLKASAISADFLGGTISVPNATLTQATTRQQLDLVLSGVDLGAIVSLADYPEVVVDGLISGYLPLSFDINDDSLLTVTDGLISALKPGGSIRYTPLGGIENSNQSIQLVNQALADYRFTTLDTTLQIDDTGDIALGVVLAGSNPDMNAGQAINLNVTISDNLTDLLRSLRASRELTDELEKRVAE